MKSESESWKPFELYSIMFGVYCPLEAFLETGLFLLSICAQVIKAVEQISWDALKSVQHYQLLFLSPKMTWLVRRDLTEIYVHANY